MNRTPPNAGKGRPKGSKNKVTRVFREGVITAYENLGGADALTDWARENPSEFYKICARLIPTEMTVDANVQGYAMRFPEPCATAEEWQEKHRLRH